MKEKELLNKSHIIPNSFFKIGLTEEEYMYRTSNLEIRQNFESPKKVYTGEFDSGILCSHCDNKVLGKLDDYGYRIIFQGFKSKRDSPIIKDVLNPKGLDYLIFKNVDYIKFKLFLLSILWRSNISSRPFFKDVNLGPYGNVLRNMLINEDPGDDKDFPVLIYMPHDKELSLKSLIGQPRKVKFKNKTSYIFVINGLIYIYIITQEILESDILNFTINKNGSTLNLME